MPGTKYFTNLSAISLCHLLEFTLSKTYAGSLRCCCQLGAHTLYPGNAPKAT